MTNISRLYRQEAYTALVEKLAKSHSFHLDRPAKTITVEKISRSAIPKTSAMLAGQGRLLPRPAEQPLVTATSG